MRSCSDKWCARVLVVGVYRACASGNGRYYMRSDPFNSTTIAFAVLFFSVPLSAQIVRLGVRAGVPLTSAFDDESTCPVSYGACGSQFTQRRYIVGPTVEFRLPASFAVTVDALYSRLAYDITLQNNSYSGLNFTVAGNTRANRWEFPTMLKYRRRIGPLRPFAGAGISIRHVSAGRTSEGFCSYGIASPYSCSSFSVSPPTGLNSGAAPGFVLGGGIDLGFGLLRVSPEVRFTRWNAAEVRFPSAHTNQAQILLGITF